ncbi:sigma-70 family RNA polymerase sigma factor [Sphingobacterium sp. DN00404]|uniref:Sigma-70 family RNA polymerase sigma factor n=1 Tax=Sphingobacterium micropteri TaxID=2763501 RepID=A0ABR7YQT2_9SPHI|nr:sigma-70 family RNA polymerase sigma factor [Sphingobacterium micropteri]MBD1433718.1 sigma-70 family RNA polymerase sigma factor [Sphingobacterium micropteri]
MGKLGGDYMDREMENTIFLNNMCNGEVEGLTTAYRLYRQPLLFFVIRYVGSREVAEDIVADIFVKAWNARTKLRRIDSLRAYLYVMAKNASLNYLRRPQAMSLEDVPADFEETLLEDDDIFGNILRTELIKSIMEEVDRLPLKQQEVFRYTFLEDMSVEEISEKLQLSATAVYANRSRAIATLRELLMKKGLVVTFSLLHTLFLQ